jgi:uncharacterized protein (DUF58 family)
MGIGGSIFLIAIGAILAFAVNWQVSGIDLNVVGWVLMILGLVGLILTMWYWNSRRRTVVSRTATRPVVRGDGYVDEYRETRDVPPPPPPGY